MNSISMKIYSVGNSEGNCSWFTIVATSTRRPSFSFKLSKSKQLFFDNKLFNYLNLTFTCKRFRSRCMFKSLSWLYKLIWKIAIWFHIYIYFLIYRTIPNPGHPVQCTYSGCWRCWWPWPRPSPGNLSQLRAWSQPISYRLWRKTAPQ